MEGLGQRLEAAENAPQEAQLARAAVAAGCDAVPAALASEADARALVRYAFGRRFGWSDAGATGAAPPVAVADTADKRAVNAAMDGLLLAMRDTSFADGRPLLAALSALVAGAADAPVVRQQASYWALEWAANTPDLSAAAGAALAPLFDAVLAGLTDVWSATRKGCAARTGALAERLPAAEVQALYARMAAVVAENGRGNWKGVEGALLGMAAVVRRERRRSGAWAVAATSDAVLFDVLAHEQLSVRENATKLAAALLRCAPRPHSQSLLRRALAALSARDPDPFEAEGLLGLVVMIVRRDRRHEWRDVYAAVGPFLAHEASTVRQGASTVCSLLGHTAEVLEALTGSWDAADWKGREGRLLAYELLLRHLISDHLERLGSSPTPPISPPRRSASAPSLSELSAAGSTPAPEESPAAPPRDSPVAAMAGSLLCQLWQRDCGGFTEVLRRLLAQTRVVLGAQQFELRRMGGQVLPLLTQVVCWFDLSLLSSAEGWSGVRGFLRARDTLRLACETLLETMAHMEKLEELLQLTLPLRQRSPSASLLSARGGGPRRLHSMSDAPLQAVIAQMDLADADGEEEEEKQQPDEAPPVVRSTSGHSGHVGLAQLMGDVRREVARVLPGFTELGRRAASDKLTALVVQLLPTVHTFLGPFSQPAELALPPAPPSTPVVPVTPSRGRGPGPHNGVDDADHLVSVAQRREDMALVFARLTAIHEQAYGAEAAHVALLRRFGPGGPPASGVRQPLLLDRTLSAALLPLLPNLTACVEPRHGALLLPLVMHWLTVRDDVRWVAVTQLQARLTLLDAARALLEPHVNVALRAQLAAGAAAGGGLSLLGGEAGLGELLLAACAHAAAALGQLLAVPGLEMSVVRQALRVAHSLMRVVPDLHLLPPLLAAVAALARPHVPLSVSVSAPPAGEAMRPPALVRGRSLWRMSNDIAPGGCDSPLVSSSSDSGDSGDELDLGEAEAGAGAEQDGEDEDDDDDDDWDDWDEESEDEEGDELVGVLVSELGGFLSVLASEFCLKPLDSAGSADSFALPSPPPVQRARSRSMELAVEETTAAGGAPLAETWRRASSRSRPLTWTYSARLAGLPDADQAVLRWLLHEHSPVTSPRPTALALRLPGHRLSVVTS